ncbi:hypothetical protein Dda_0091 [Drechslerella dactyloides]|uniref:Uncharacterized protein n=1 Tax=Drechslerella dactyloides TaxID=74499 RepID=A0AAD6J3Q8_DREDA|nr:hypothetical protein Dda_0091 [Drechslerella dactyloides]
MSFPPNREFPLWEDPSPSEQTPTRQPPTARGTTVTSTTSSPTDPAAQPPVAAPDDCICYADNLLEPLNTPCSTHGDPSGRLEALLPAAHISTSAAAVALTLNTAWDLFKFRVKRKHTHIEPSTDDIALYSPTSPAFRPQSQSPTQTFADALANDNLRPLLDPPDSGYLYGNNDMARSYDGPEMPASTPSQPEDERPQQPTTIYYEDASTQAADPLMDGLPPRVKIAAWRAATEVVEDYHKNGQDSISLLEADLERMSDAELSRLWEESRARLEEEKRNCLRDLKERYGLSGVDEDVSLRPVTPSISPA